MACEESVGSIFHNGLIDCLTDCEVSEFFTNAFNQRGIDISPLALKVITVFSSGLPLMMHYR